MPDPGQLISGCLLSHSQEPGARVLGLDAKYTDVPNQSRLWNPQLPSLVIRGSQSDFSGNGGGMAFCRISGQAAESLKIQNQIRKGNSPREFPERGPWSNGCVRTGEREATIPENKQTFYS